MSRREGQPFSIASLVEMIKTKSDGFGPTIHALRSAEDQAIWLTRLFERKNFVMPEQLLPALMEQPLPPVDLKLVVAFLGGYLAAEIFDSRFDVEVFGPIATNSGKDRVAASAATGLLNLMNEENIFDLPPRISPKKLSAEKKEAPRKKAEKKSKKKK